MISAETSCVLVGDCCHSFHPFLAQGLNLGLEDAATLSHLLSHMKSPNHLSKALLLYDRLRTDRARKILEETCIQVDKLGWPEGELQKRPHEEPMDKTAAVHDW